MSYIPPQFRISDRTTLDEFMTAHDFATVVSAPPNGPIVSHVPVIVSWTGESCTLIGHVARTNPHWRVMDGATAAVAIFHGPHGYVSPTWYETAPAVPTWNYGVVHAHGHPTAVLDESFLRGVLDALVQRYEAQSLKLPKDFYDKMVKAVVPFAMPVVQLDGKFKLGQNRSVADREATILALEREGSTEAASLAGFMRRYAF